MKDLVAELRRVREVWRSLWVSDSSSAISSEQEEEEKEDEDAVSLRKRKSRLREKVVWRREWVMEGRVVGEEGLERLGGLVTGGLRGVEKLDGSDGLKEAAEGDGMAVVAVAVAVVVMF